MPKMKRGSGAKKRFKVTGSGKLMFRRRRRRATPGIKTAGKQKSSQKDGLVAPSDESRVKKLLGLSRCHA